MPPQGRVLYDDNGNPITDKSAPVFYDDSGKPVSDPAAASRATRAMELNKAQPVINLLRTKEPETVESVMGPNATPEDMARYGPGLQRFISQQREQAKPSSLIRGLATLIPGGIPAQMLAQFGAGVAGRVMDNDGPPQDAITGGLGDAAVTGLLGSVGPVVRAAAPRVKQAGLSVLNSVLDIPDKIAALAPAADFGKNIRAGKEQLVRTIAALGKGAPTQNNKYFTQEMRERHAQDVGKAALIPPKYPNEITDPARQLPYQASSRETVPTGTSPTHDTLTLSPSQMTFKDNRYGQLPYMPDRPADTGSPSPAGSSSPFPQVGRSPGLGDQAETLPQFLGEGTRGVPPVPAGPGVVTRDVPPKPDVFASRPGTGGQPGQTKAQLQEGLASLEADIAGAKSAGASTKDLEAAHARLSQMLNESEKPNFQPADTLRRDDLVTAVKADITDAEQALKPTTGLLGLLDRLTKLPEYISRAQAQDIKTGIYERNAPKYHNAINDPTLVSSEKGIASTIREGMSTPEFDKANARFGLSKPVEMAVSNAADRKHTAVSPKAAATHVVAGTLGALADPTHILGGAGAALASLGLAHPVVQGHIGQGLYNLGTGSIPKHLQGISTPEMVRMAIQRMLLSQQGK